ncbi:uncharacterized protein LOC127264461 [Andrographis paniculata]|uniref:uncharacterized protein LOC127264461 n=1 Tax=Andrographis paniculata TaxID=175694 RepID=UPI0021E90F6C|nr:uncharacterized protein LOC127264461 [Andrographis paniculata]
MAQYRQFGGSANGFRNSLVLDHGVRSASRHFHLRRSKHLPFYRRVILGFWLLALFLILFMLAFFYLSLQTKGGEINRQQVQDDNVGDMGIDTDFLTNVTRTQKSKEPKFGRGSIAHGENSRYLARNDGRRKNDYDEDKWIPRHDDSEVNDHTAISSKNIKSFVDKSDKILSQRGNDLYNEAGRKELKLYESEYEASSKGIGKSKDASGERNQHSISGDDIGRKHEALDDSDEYDDGLDSQDDHMEEYNDARLGDRDHTIATIETGSSPDRYHAGKKKKDNMNEAHEASYELSKKEYLPDTQHSSERNYSGSLSINEDQPTQKLISERQFGSKKKSKRRKFSGSCDMKILNASALVEPLESRKFARFSLHYTEEEQKPNEDQEWAARFGGHQSLKEREESFLARDQKINCGFVKGPKGSPSTGFDLAEDDAKYISSCHIAVMSCIFGNSDRLRSPVGKMVSRSSRKNVCFVMFVDEVTLQTLSSEGQMPDMMGFVGLWKIVVVKNLPFSDMRRVGKIPKFLAHRLFSSARYSIWLDSKLRLQLDPMLILEYFLWRKGYEYAISNHYDRHCLWEEVAQNKKLNKYNHTIIEEQFAFYQADGMKRFSASDPNKLLPSNVPEGSFIVRAHTPMSNLFSCLWFNEVDRFTPRDQLSFGYTFHKLRWMNPDKPFYLHMFKDCERRKIAKLYHHRSQEKRRNPQQM